MIVIPARCWTEVIDRFTSTPGVGERVAFLDGVPGGPSASEGGIVTTVTFPDARNDELAYRVEAEAMSEAGRHLRAYGLVRLAQVHTHPGPWTGHSEVDDAEAYAQTPGAVSIVLPTWGLTHPGLGDAGVHLRDRGGWRRVAADELARVAVVVPSVLDFRR